MAIEIIMPRLTHDMTHGILTNWLKEEGDQVVSGDPLFEVETDKAVSEVPAEDDGILRGIQYQISDKIPIGSTMAYLLKNGEALPKLPDAIEKEVIKSTPNEKEASVEAKSDHQPIPPLSRIIATPLAKRIALDHNIDLTKLSGTGPRGRIIEKDVRNFLDHHGKTVLPPQQFIGEPSFEEVPLSQYQRITGNRLTVSATTIPHFILEVDVDMSEAQRWRSQYFENFDHKISYTVILTKVTAQALHLHPIVNSSFAGDSIKVYKEININVAMATPKGLVAPVIHQTNKLTTHKIQEKIIDLLEASKKESLSPTQIGGGTFTISNLGMYGIDRFHAIINPPQTAILAAGRIRSVPWSISDQIVTRPIMTLRMSIDHRALDGAMAAPFLNTVKELLENPYLLL